jgi:hypothetical protein
MRLQHLREQYFCSGSFGSKMRLAVVGGAGSLFHARNHIGNPVTGQAQIRAFLWKSWRAWFPMNWYDRCYP